MVRYFTQLYPFGTTIMIQKNSGCLLVVKGRWNAYIKQKRGYSEKGKGTEEPTKEDVINIKMPGFVTPENMKEEGYFTEKAKKQLEELKNKPEKTSVGSPDKKS